MALQAGDPATLELWRALVHESEEHFDVVYGLLGVLLDAQALAGESSYQDQLAAVVEEAERGS